MHAHARRLLLPRWPTARTHAVGQAEVARVKVLLERDERKRQRESSATPASFNQAAKRHRTLINCVIGGVLDVDFKFDN